MSHYYADKAKIDPDSDWQDSVAALLDEPTAPTRPVIDIGGRQGRGQCRGIDRSVVLGALIGVAAVVAGCVIAASGRGLP